MRRSTKDRCFGAMNSPLRDVLSEVEATRSMGFDYAELTMDAPEAHHEVLARRLDEIRSSLKPFTCPVVCHLPTFVSVADMTPALREASIQEMISSLRVARELQPRCVVLHPGHASGMGRKDPARAGLHAMNALERLLGEAEDLGLRPALENMPPGSGSLVEPEDFQEVFSRFPALEMTLDLAHGHIGDESGTRNLAFIDRFADRIAHVHVSDNDGTRDMHLPLGVGSLDLGPVIGALISSGYQGAFTLEIFAPDRDYLVMSRTKLAAIVSGA
ncbi:MAG: sugar phosphate isomerase/epimerase family protein [Desulfobacteraceae bacterium]